MITQRVSTKILVALAVSSAVLLAGCSGDSTAQEPQAPAPAAETPTPTVPALAPPVLSTQARQPSQAGAEAFVQYWWAARDYGYKSGDAGPLRAASDLENCNTCAETAQGIFEMQTRGERVVGGDVVIVSSQLLKSFVNPTAFKFNLVLDNPETVFVDAQGKPVKTSEAQPNTGADILVEWVDQRWRVVYLVKAGVGR